MSHPYFFINKSDIKDNSYCLKGDDFFHLARSVRARPGDPVELSDNESFRYLSTIEQINKDSALLIIERHSFISKKIPQLLLFQCILKKEPMELSIQKSTEIGADCIIPVTSSRVVADPGKDKMDKKIARWQQIALQASKQCMRDHICRICEPVNLNNINVADFDIFFMPAEDKDIARNNALAFLVSGNMFKNKKLRASKNIAFIIGPEGGLSKQESVLLQEKGAIPINFGKNILRAETAAIYFMSVLDFLIKTSGV